MYKELDPFGSLESGFPEKVPKPVRPLKIGYLPAQSPWLWLARADELGGSALAVGLIALRNHARTSPYGWPNRVGLDSGEPLGLGRRAVRQGLKRLADGGLIEVDTKAGRKPVVTIQDYPPALPDEPPQYIHYRVPWPWICRATRCPTPALIVGLAAWRFDYMTRERGVSRFQIDPLSGSTRAAVALQRGLTALESAGLVELIDAPRGYARLRICKQIDTLKTGNSDDGTN